MKYPLLKKAAAMAALMVVLLVALGQVQGLVDERRARQAQAVGNVAASLAGDQAVVGPVIVRVCDEQWTHVEGAGADRVETVEHQSRSVLDWPKRLDGDWKSIVEPRHRGLFKVNGYLAEGTLRASWDPLAVPPPDAEHPGAVVTCDAGSVAVALSDARGIRAASVRVDGRPADVRSGGLLTGHAAGFHALLPAAATAAGNIEITLALAGTQRLAFVPVGGQTSLHLVSDWPHPSFGGRFLPVFRRVSAGGFDARWAVSALATSARATLADGAPLCAWTDEAGGDSTPASPQACGVDTFGVSYMDPVGPYVLSDRAVKYGLLFVTLTFVAVALVEALRRVRVHPVQYLLVGCAITIFFLLLLSLSEHLRFGTAYALASTACTALLAFYGTHVLRGRRAGLVFGAGVGILYGALYAVLQMEQAALVLGSVLLFAVLAAVMVVTRRIDWYALGADLSGVAPDRPAPGPTALAARPE